MTTKIGVPNFASHVSRSLQSEGYRSSIKKYIDLMVVSAFDDGSKRCKLLGIHDVRSYNPMAMRDALEQTEATLGGAAEMVRRSFPEHRVEPAIIYHISDTSDRDCLDAALQLYMGNVIACSKDTMWIVRHDEHGVPVWNTTNFLSPQKNGKTPSNTGKLQAV